MKRIFLPLVLLAWVALGGLGLSDMLNKWLILRAPSSSSYKTYRLFIEQPPHEIPLLGSSRALGNYVPSLISDRVFDYGINGSGMYETLFMLRQALRNPTPGAVIVNLDPWGFRGEYNPSLQGNYLLALSSAHVRENVRHEFTDRVPGIRFHGRLRSNITTWLDGKTGLTRRVDHGAALIVHSRSEKEWAIINDKIADSTFDCHVSWQMELDKIQATTNHPIVWVVSPVAPHWREHYKGRARMKDFLSKLAARPNMYVVDLFDETADYAEAEFVDPTHLNVNGATRFTQQLVPYLKKLPIWFQ